MKKIDPQTTVPKTMTAEQFRNWRKGLDLRQKEAADLLGLKKRMIQYYEKGNRDGKPVEIPKTVRLACYAISTGVTDFDGDHPTVAPPMPAMPEDAAPELAESLDESDMPVAG